MSQFRNHYRLIKKGNYEYLSDNDDKILVRDQINPRLGKSFKIHLRNTYGKKFYYCQNLRRCRGNILVKIDYHKF